MMPRLRLVFLAILAAALTAGTAMAQAERSPVTETSDEGRNVLVMLDMRPEHYRANAGYSGAYGSAMAQAARTRLARRIERRHELELVESWPMPLLGVDCFVMRIPEGVSRDQIVARLNLDKDVQWSQPLETFHSMAAAVPPDDPLFRAQPVASQWHLAALHRVATGRGVKVAVIDSQVEATHPDLIGQVATARDFVSQRRRTGERHGTNIAGVIGAASGNSQGIVGVAPDARLLALRACQESGGGTVRGAACQSLAVAKALHFAIESNADVINLSLSGPHDRLLDALIKIGLDRNIAIVASFDPDLPDGGFPASRTGVFAIADDALPSVPSFVYKAPGRDIPTTMPGGSWGLVSGNSFATAHVSGLLALLLQHHGASSNLPRLSRTRQGVVDACASLESAHSCICTCPASPE